MLTQNNPSQCYLALTIMLTNIVGLSSKYYFRNYVLGGSVMHLLCIQETHRDTNENHLKINGIQITTEFRHKICGSAVLTKSNRVI